MVHACPSHMIDYLKCTSEFLNLLDIRIVACHEPMSFANHIPTSVFLIYEFVVTFDREVACFWTGKWNGASLLFFAHKWISVTLSVMTLSRFAHFPSDEVSNINAYLGQI